MDAAVILAKCYKTKKMYGMRSQKMNDGDWWRTWAFPIDEKRARKLSCWNGETRLTCLWCGNDMNNIATATEKFNLSGGDI